MLERCIILEETFCKWAVGIVSDTGFIAYHPVMQNGLFRRVV
jgi:hypothetical protein